MLIGLKRPNEDPESNFIWQDGSAYQGFHGVIKTDSDFEFNRWSCVCVERVGKEVFARNTRCSDELNYVCQKKGMMPL